MEFKEKDLKPFGIPYLIDLFSKNKELNKVINNSSSLMIEIIIDNFGKPFFEKHGDSGDKVIACVFQSLALTAVGIMKIFNETLDVPLETLSEKFRDAMSIAPIILHFIRVEAEENCSA